MKDESNQSKLEYRDWRQDAPQRRRFVAELIGGIVAGVVAVVVSGIAWGLANIHFAPPSSPAAPFQTTRLNWSGPLTCTAVFLGLLALLGLIARRAGRRGLWMGMLLGAGITLLIEGACFYSSWT